MAEIEQVFTVEYLVPGSLDGVTPSPGFSIDAAAPNGKRADADGVFRFSAEEMAERTGGNLGLLDLTTPFDGSQNLFANRLVTWFYLEAPGAPGAAGAAVDSVNVRDGMVTRQILHAGLSGVEDFFGTGFFVPQASRLRIDGFTAGGVPILVRLNINFFETLDDLLAVLPDGVPGQGRFPMVFGVATLAGAGANPRHLWPGAGRTIAQPELVGEPLPAAATIRALSVHQQRPPAVSPESVTYTVLVNGVATPVSVTIPVTDGGVTTVDGFDVAVPKDASIALAATRSGDHPTITDVLANVFFST